MPNLQTFDPDQPEHRDAEWASVRVLPHREAGIVSETPTMLAWAKDMGTVLAVMLAVFTLGVLASLTLVQVTEWLSP